MHDAINQQRDQQIHLTNKQKTATITFTPGAIIAVHKGQYLNRLPAELLGFNLPRIAVTFGPMTCVLCTLLCTLFFVLYSFFVCLIDQCIISSSKPLDHQILYYFSLSFSQRSHPKTPQGVLSACNYFIGQPLQSD